MNDRNNWPDLQTALKTLWGATTMPFAASVTKPFAAGFFTEVTHRLEQLLAVRACGLLHGPNGVGKSLLLQHFLQSLPEKRFKTIVLSHSSLTGSDLLRLLCLELGKTPRMRRGDNLALIRQAWQELDRLWPLLVLEEAQDLSATALEEIRLLSCERRDTQTPFTLLLVGDNQLLPRLQLGINAPLLARLSFCLQLQPWNPADLQAYLSARLQEVGIHSNPFDAQAIELLVSSAQGLPRQLNHLAQRALAEAARLNCRVVSPNHVQSALDLMPWIVQF
jgi:type II secretory pathway predicted ATPase ExeA